MLRRYGRKGEGKTEGSGPSVSWQRGCVQAENGPRGLFILSSQQTFVRYLSPTTGISLFLLVDVYVLKHSHGNFREAPARSQDKNCSICHVQFLSFLTFSLLHYLSQSYSWLSEKPSPGKILSECGSPWVIKSVLTMLTHSVPNLIGA